VQFDAHLFAGYGKYGRAPIPVFDKKTWGARGNFVVGLCKIACVQSGADLKYLFQIPK